MQIYTKLAIIQKKLKCEKSQYNSFGKYKYRSCEDILKAVKPLLDETKTVLTLSDELVAIGERYYVKATATLLDAEESKDVPFISTTAYAREEETKKGMDGSQITGTASSYARKYALGGLFDIDDGIDSDATNMGDNAKPRAKATATQSKTTIDFNEVDEKIKNATTVQEVRTIYAGIPKPLQKYFEEKCKNRTIEINMGDE